MGKEEQGRRNWPVSVTQYDYHSNSLYGCVSYQGFDVKIDIGNLPGTLLEEIIFTVNVDHTILEDALPLVLHPRNL